MNEEIPADLLEKARQITTNFRVQGDIARALFEERERCARIAAGIVRLVQRVKGKLRFPGAFVWHDSPKNARLFRSLPHQRKAVGR
jgi:hypothetical protein